MPSPLPLPPYLRSFAEEVLALSTQLKAAQDVQWVASPRPSADTDGIRGSGTYSDPTFRTVADTGRLRVRAAVAGAEVALRNARAEVAAASGAVEDALAGWSGAR